ncbi:helix-turn-helix domain-containing protein [Mycolicibacterium gilvum]|uniref:excisionase family DNA-binding protein n=1 Tax=Mycolicibacterium gilvum TaxID=1804 RepID=UPI00404588C6
MTVWHTVESAAEHAKVSTWTIRQAVKDGDLPASTVRSGRTIRIKEACVDAWLESMPFEPGRLA